MTKARDRVIQYVKEQIAFEEGRGPERDYTASVVRRILTKIEVETKW